MNYNVLLQIRIITEATSIVFVDAFIILYNLGQSCDRPKHSDEYHIFDSHVIGISTVVDIPS